MSNRIEIKNDLRPAYYDDFHCLAAGCRYSCCNGWRVQFSKKEYLALKRQKGGEEFNQRLEHALRRIRKGTVTDERYGEFDMSSGSCPLLQEDCLCSLQVEKGHKALPRVCRVFPRTAAYMPSGYLERSLSPACEGVLELLWNLPEGVDFRSDPLPREEWRDINIRDDQPLAVFFPEIREWCVDMLQDRRFPLAKRILLMGIALKELADGEEDAAAWLLRARVLPEQGEDLLLQTDDAVLSMRLINHLRTIMLLQGDRDYFTSIPDELIAGIGLESIPGTDQTSVSLELYQKARARYEERFGERAYFMENLMVALFFYLCLPHLDSREELWKGYVNFCNMYSFYRFLAVMSCREGAAGNQAELFRLLVFAGHRLLHNGVRQSSLRDELFQNDSASLAHMAILLGE